MIDVFLLVFVLVTVGVAVAMNVHLLLYFQQPEDSKFASSICCKAIIVISLTLCWFVNILLPIDVRNSRPIPGILDMQLLWVITFITLASFLVLIVPGAMFYMEVEGDDMVRRKHRHVICNITLTLFFVICSVVISYPFLGHAAFPVVNYSCGSFLEADDHRPMGELGADLCSSGGGGHVELKVGFDIYIIAVLCFIGWFFFVIFGGIGLSAVPLDMILAFIDRPQPIDEVTYRNRRKDLGLASRNLLVKAEELQGRDSEASCDKGWSKAKSKRQIKTEYNKFKRDVHLLEQEFERMKLSKFHKGENLAVSIAKLLLGIIFALLSIMWVLHVLLVIVLPKADPSIDTGFLNEIFEAFEAPGLYPVGVALFASFTLYLLLCVVKGCMKFGMRIFFVFSIHPMRHHGTPLNSILFNVEMLLLCSAAVAQFAQSAFSDYARLTDADVIFAAQIKYMAFYSWFFDNGVFIYLLLGWFLLTLIYLLCKPRDESDIKWDKKAGKKLAILAGGTKGTKSPASMSAARA
mmetsp:Transcript_30299/g.64485  ORF Transcript_30299/g.64485 Transcript_30299/m.64485 type:complete len:521 (-) Transcript_30299:103-1665(-)